MTSLGILEESTYAAAVAALGLGVRRLDEVIVGVMWALARAADDDSLFPDVIGNGIRLARATTPGGNVIRVWFVLDRDSAMVCLVHIDSVEPSAEEDESW